MKCEVYLLSLAFLFSLESMTKPVLFNFRVDLLLGEKKPGQVSEVAQLISQTLNKKGLVERAA